jgi:hypothetical protein
MDDSTPSTSKDKLIISLLSGGADTAINVWDLEALDANQEESVIDALGGIPAYSQLYHSF